MPKLIPRYVKEDEVGQESDNSAKNDLLLFDKKVAFAVEGLEPFFDKILRRQTPKENALIVAEYINTGIRETNISNGYRRSNIQALVELSKFHLSTKNFEEMTREDNFYIWIVFTDQNPQIPSINGLALII